MLLSNRLLKRQARRIISSNFCGLTIIMLINLLFLSLLGILPGFIILALLSSTNVFAIFFAFIPFNLLKIGLIRTYIKLIRYDKLQFRHISYAISSGISKHCFSILTANFMRYMKRFSYRFHHYRYLIFDTYSMIYYVRADKPKQSSAESIEDCENMVSSRKEYYLMKISFLPLLVVPVIIYVFIGVIPVDAYNFEHLIPYPWLKTLCLFAVPVYLIYYFMYYYLSLTLLYDSIAPPKKIEDDTFEFQEIDLNIKYNIIKDKITEGEYEPNPLNRNIRDYKPSVQITEDEMVRRVDSFDS